MGCVARDGGLILECPSLVGCVCAVARAAGREGRRVMMGMVTRAFACHSSFQGRRPPRRRAMASDPDLPSPSGSSSMDDEKDDAAPSFRAAAAAVEAAAAARDLPQAAGLRLYALFKQASAGDAPERGPNALLDPRGRAKWSAWAGVRGTGAAAAQRAYAAEAARAGVVEAAAPGRAPPPLSSLGPVLSVPAGALAGGGAPPLPPLSAAAADGDAAGVRAALEAGGSVGGADEDGATALHFAADAGCEGCVRLLLDAGADVDAVDKEGGTPAAYARAAGRERVAVLLAEEGRREVL